MNICLLSSLLLRYFQDNRRSFLLAIVGGLCVVFRTRRMQLVSVGVLNGRLARGREKNVTCSPFQRSGFSEAIKRRLCFVINAPDTHQEPINKTKTKNNPSQD
jgi:hypothetical protein